LKKRINADTPPFFTCAITTNNIQLAANTNAAGQPSELIEPNQLLPQPAQPAQ